MSLNARILISATLVVVIFVALTGVALESAFYNSAAAARRDRLEAQLYLLLAEAEVSAEGKLELPATLTEARLALPGSGLYAQISNASQRVMWRSPSTLGLSIPFQTKLNPGQSYFQEVKNQAGQTFFLFSLGVNWSTTQQHYRFTFSISEDLREFNATLTRYRKSLWGWLGAMAALLLLVQSAILRWGLRPLRRVATDLAAIEAGKRLNLEGSYPKELARLTDNINSLITQERAQQTRYRNALGDLAHSLKTPLAVLRATVTGIAIDAQSKKAIDDEVQRMNNLIEHQLQRAAMAGASKLAAPVLIAPIAAKLINSLDKIHPSRDVRQKIQADVYFRGDKGDLTELLGNLLDNAYKWAHATLFLEICYRQGKLYFIVEDDGPGIAADDAERVMQRGQRADTTTPGHGLGLAIVQDICAAYDGEIEVGKSKLGGSRIGVTFSQR